MEPCCPTKQTPLLTSSTADRSQSGRTHRLKSKTIASAATSAISQFKEPSARLLFRQGQTSTETFDQIGVLTSDPGSIPAMSGSISDPNGYYPLPPYDVSYNYVFDLTWLPVPGALAYIVTLSSNDQYLVVSTGPTSASLYLVWDGLEEPKYIYVAAQGVPCPPTPLSFLINPHFYGRNTLSQNKCPA